MGVFKPVGLILKPFYTKCAIKTVGSSHWRSGLEPGDAMSLSLLASALERALHLSVCLSDWKSV
jgi:predicted anti-sigma-YlaC factor YlaD